MAYNYDYGGDVGVMRPGVSRRSRASDVSSRGSAYPLQKSTSMSVNANRISSYSGYNGDSNRLNRSISGSKQYNYKLDNIDNKLAERNNPLMSFYKEKSASRIKTAERTNDSSGLKRNIENYGRPPSGPRYTAPENKDASKIFDKPPINVEHIPDSRRSSRGQITYSRALKNSGENLMQTSATRAIKQKHLDVIYEDEGGSDDLDPRQKEILEKYYLKSRRNLRPSQRKMKTPLMTPDNNIQFVDNGDLIRNPKPTRTPPPPMWGEESEIDETAGEPFYDINSDPARNSKTLMHLDSSRTRRKQFIKSKLEENGIEDPDVETVIIQSKRAPGSKLKKKIVYVYDSDSDDDIQKPQERLSSKNNYANVSSSRRAETHAKSPDAHASKPYHNMPPR
jgi:hypothetical protein